MEADRHLPVPGEGRPDEDLIAEGESLAAAATPGPWELWPPPQGTWAWTTVARLLGEDGLDETVGVSDADEVESASPNAALIVWLRNNFAALAASLRSSRDERRQMEEALERAGEWAESLRVGLAWHDCASCDDDLAHLVAALRSSSSTPEEQT